LDAGCAEGGRRARGAHSWTVRADLSVVVGVEAVWTFSCANVIIVEIARRARRTLVVVGTEACSTLNGTGKTCSIYDELAFSTGTDTQALPSKVTSSTHRAHVGAGGAASFA
jgi:hypothetical protein